MGSCCSRRPRFTPLDSPSTALRKRKGSDNLSKEEIEVYLLEASIIAEEQFRISMRQQLKASQPLSGSEMEKTMKRAYSQLEKTFTSYFLGAGKPSSVPYIEVISTLNEIKEKCKAKEVFYRYINDKNSYEQYVKLKKNLVRKLINQEVTPKTLVDQYQAQAAGTYGLQGLQDIHEIITEFNNGEDAVYQLVRKQSMKDLDLIEQQFEDTKRLFDADDYDILSLIALRNKRADSFGDERDLVKRKSLGPDIERRAPKISIGSDRGSEKSSEL